MRIASADPRSGSYKVIARTYASLLGMGEKKLALQALICAVVFTCTGCAAGAGEASASQSVAAAFQSDAEPSKPAISPVRAERLAQNLADAEMAHDNGERARLGELVSALYASGLGPRGEGQADVIAQWAVSAGSEATPFRGRLLGPAYVRGELGPGQSWKSAQTFKSGEPSTLAVSHKGSGPVSISVSDQRSRSVCDAKGSKKPSCRFTPLYTQRYSIELVNEGPERAVYFLVFD